MKRGMIRLGFWGCLVLMGCFLCSTPCFLTARADVIWEPQDTFYEQHASECVYVNRWFTADGPDGVVMLYKSPLLPEVVDTWDNGHEAFIAFTYEDEDGVVWGINEGRETGWMPMDYMKVVYDEVSFKEEYGYQIRPETGTLEDQYAGEEVYFWNYPGAAEGNSITIEGDMPQYNGVFTDEKGHEWGKVGYYYGYKNVWVCLDDPKGDYGELYPQGGPERGDSAGQLTDDREDVDGSDRIVPKTDQGAVMIVVVMVLAVALGTAVLLLVLYLRSGRKK